MNFAKDFEDMFDKIASVITSRVRATPLFVNTMTFSGRFDTKDIPIDRIRREVTFASDQKLCGSKTDVICRKKPRATTRKFDHQASFKIGTSCIKLFSNGSVHGTGFSTPHQFLNAVLLVGDAVRDVVGEDLVLIDVKTNMINVSTSVMNSAWRPIKFNLKRLSETFTREDVDADFNPEKHPASRVTLFEQKKKVCTALLYPTGSISIFGSKEPRHIAAMYEIVLSAMDENVHLSMPCELRKTTLKTPFSISHGYPTCSLELLRM